MTTFLRLLRLLVAFAALLGGIAGLQALPAQGAWSPHYDMPGFGVGGRVFALGTWRNELIAGTYRSPWRDGSWLHHVARFDGVRWYPLGSGMDAHVRAALEFQGDLWIGGAFGTAGGVPAARVARWDGTQWHNAGAGFDGEVWALCEYQGALYAAGSFEQSGGQSVSRIARWNGSQWLPVGGGLQWQFGMYAVGRTLATDGTFLYVGGEFDRAGGVPASHVARWNGSTWQPLGGGINNFGWGIVYALCAHQGRIYCGGAFGQAGSVLADNIAAWDGGQWSAVGQGVQGTIYGVSVASLCVFNNELYVGGSFPLSGSTALHRVARYDGVQLRPIGGVDQAETNPPTVIAMTAWNNRLYCGGEFQVAGQPFVPTETISAFHLAAYDGTAWSAVGEGLGLDGGIHALGYYQGQLVAVGRFSLAGGNRAYRVARFDGDDWRYFGNFDGAVTGMTLHNNELWVAGQFYYAEGIVANGVARFDGTNWHAVGGGPGPSQAYCIASYQGMIHVGSVGSPLRWNGSSWQAFTPAITGAITVMHEHLGVLYMGGFTPYHPGNPNLFAWNGAVLSVPGGGLNDSVESLGSFNNELIAGGHFTLAGGVPARSIARWNGSSWSTFGAGIQGATVQAIATFRGSLVIGGDFSNFQGAPAEYVARWTGSSWAPLAAAQPNAPVSALLADDARGELHAGGGFWTIGASDSVCLGVFQQTPFWTDVGAALANPRRAPRLSGDGRLLPGARTRWRLSSAAESSLCIVAMGLSTVNVPLFGGVLVPNLDATLLFVTDPIGTATHTITWPGGLPGFQCWTQAWILDPTGPFGFTASNAVLLRAP